MKAFHGNGVSPGTALGALYVYQPFTCKLSEGNIEKDAVGAELARYEDVMARTGAELERVRAAVEDPDKQKIFEAHLELLHDPELDEGIRTAVTEQLTPADRAADMVFEQYAEILAGCGDALFAERAADLRDVKNRFLRIWNGVAETNLSHLGGPVIVAARDLLPSDTATLDRENVLGIVTEIGGATSHSAIIAKSYGIPAVLGITGLLAAVESGTFAVLDAESGRLVVDPDEAVKAEFVALREAFLARAEIVRQYLDKPSITADGETVQLGVNIGSGAPAELAGTERADFVGLFRTEFLYMGNDHMPTEEEQFAAYKKILTAFAPRPVVLRTLDIGGDKSLSYFELPKEENPFLGCRALRLCLAHPDLFRTQLRAALRASVYGNLWLMLPMVGALDDIRAAKAFLAGVKRELDAEGLPYSDTIRFGIMIEVPSIALMADHAAKEVDFASIGTNDLCQYLTAADRGNPEVAGYYQNYHPALFRTIRTVAAAFRAAGKPLSVCGELGGDRLAAPVLAGLGIRKLSMSLPSFPLVKQSLAALTVEELTSLADAVCNAETAAEAEALIRDELTRHAG